MRVAGYIRVSSVMQVDQGHSLDAQRTLISDCVHTKGWSLVTVFSDVGLSGTLSSRPGLQSLLAHAARGELDVVVVHALDRFYRDLPRRLLTLEQLRQHHVAFVSVSEHLDFTSPWDKLGVLGFLAEIYTDKLRAETTKGKWHIPRVPSRRDREICDLRDKRGRGRVYGTVASPSAIAIVCACPAPM